jgi:hypothetical protein
MPDAAYYRAWRAAHPEYRARQNGLRNARRRLNGRSDRPALPVRVRARPRSEPPPVPEINQVDLRHALYERGVSIVGGFRKPQGGTFVFASELIHAEAIQVAVLAILERRDPRKAVAAFKTREYGWLRSTRSLTGLVDEQFTGEVAA